MADRNTLRNKRISMAADGVRRSQAILLDGDCWICFGRFQDVADPTPKAIRNGFNSLFSDGFALVLNFHASKDSLQEKWMTADNDDQRSSGLTFFYKLRPTKRISEP